MNLLLIEQNELGPEGEVTLTGRRAKHIHEVLRSQPSDSLRAGLIGGRIGLAHLLKVESDKVRVRFEALLDPPKPLPVKLVLALPRPKVFKRVLAHATSLGVKEIVLLNAYRVEKAYWSSDRVTPECVRECSVLGLEQAGDTVLPQVTFERLFKPFVEDRFAEFSKGTRALVAHPVAKTEAPQGLSEPLTIVIGPEGGFIPFEVELLEKAGAEPIRLGQRILKVETALAFLCARLTVALP